MAKNLVIVESPAKAKTINKYLGSDYRVLASIGHIKDLPSKGLGVDVEHDFEPTYEVIPDTKKRNNRKIVAELNPQLIRDYERIRKKWHGTVVAATHTTTTIHRNDDH